MKLTANQRDVLELMILFPNRSSVFCITAPRTS